MTRNPKTGQRLANRTESHPAEAIAEAREAEQAEKPIKFQAEADQILVFGFLKSNPEPLFRFVMPSQNFQKPQLCTESTFKFTFILFTTHFWSKPKGRF